MQCSQHRQNKANTEQKVNLFSALELLRKGYEKLCAPGGGCSTHPENKFAGRIMPS